MFLCFYENKINLNEKAYIHNDPRGQKRSLNLGNPILWLMAQQSQAFLKNQPVDSSCQQIYLRRKPALDQLDSRIDRAAANVTSYQTMFLCKLPPRHYIWSLLAQIQYLHRNL